MNLKIGSILGHLFLPRRKAGGRSVSYGSRFGLNLRQWTQLIFLAVTIAVGVQFAIFVHQAESYQWVTVHRPPGVEGFLPIGALMGWKLFMATGLWDPVHPAAMVILGIAVFTCFLLRKSFCSWICPVGCLSEWLWRAGRRMLGHSYQIPKWFDMALRCSKYALLGFFVWVILRMDARAIFEFLQSPYYKMSDVKMLHFFTRMSGLSGGILLFLMTGSLFVRNFWCRYLCPYGALMGLLAFIGPSHIHRRADTCNNCGRCAKACPYHLAVDRKDIIASPECTACLECIQACPVRGTLSLQTLGLRKKNWTMVGLGITIVLIFIFSISAARLTGHWHSRVDMREYRNLLQQIDAPQLIHPGVGKN